MILIKFWEKILLCDILDFEYPIISGNFDISPLKLVFETTGELKKIFKIFSIEWANMSIGT